MNFFQITKWCFLGLSIRIQTFLGNAKLVSPNKMNTDLQPWLLIIIVFSLSDQNFLVCQIPIENKLLDRTVWFWQKNNQIFIISPRAWKASWRSKKINWHFNSNIYQNFVCIQKICTCSVLQPASQFPPPPSFPSKFCFAEDPPPSRVGGHQPFWKSCSWLWEGGKFFAAGGQLADPSRLCRLLLPSSIRMTPHVLLSSSPPPPGFPDSIWSNFLSQKNIFSFTQIHWLWLHNKLFETHRKLIWHN